MLPDYIAKLCQPAEKTAPWYANTAQLCRIFLWIAFYESMSDGTLNPRPC